MKPAEIELMNKLQAEVVRLESENRALVKHCVKLLYMLIHKANLDRTDLEILRCYDEDNDISLNKTAEKVLTSKSNVAKRWKKMLKLGMGDKKEIIKELKNRGVL